MIMQVGMILMKRSYLNMMRKTRTQRFSARNACVRVLHQYVLMRMHTPDPNREKHETDQENRPGQLARILVL